MALFVTLFGTHFWHVLQSIDAKADDMEEQSVVLLIFRGFVPQGPWLELALQVHVDWGVKNPPTVDPFEHPARRDPWMIQWGVE